MECGSNYASGFLKYLSDFVANIRPDDPLPVRAPSYKVTESEIDGQILDIVHHYLNSRECPPYVREYVGHRVWSAIRNPGLNGDGDDQVDAANTTNHTYDAMKLIQEVTAKANTVIREMQANLTVEEVEKLPRYYPISHFAIKNTRRKMEDRHVIIPDLNTLYGMEYQSPHAYYGVFDGHAGTDAAVYSAAHLHQYMIQNPQYETNPEAALKHAFHITDTNFIKKAAKERLKGGTTAVVALVREKRLVVAWLGDSQALLVRRRNPVRMVEPHKPELPVERERVEEMGGCVINIQGTWRVLGQLAVSRAIGDVDYKPYVSSECDIKSLEIEGDEDFLILACDGLWDTLTPEAAVNVVYAYLTHNDGDTDGVGRCLVEAARNAGSEDNITAVVVFLRPVATLMEEEAQRIAQGQVPDPVPASIIYKDTTPSSLNAIFSPPINQFEYSTPTTPPFNPFETDEPIGAGPYDVKSGAATESALTPATLDFKDVDEPMIGSEAPRNLGQDSDSDEGIAGGAEGGPEPAFNPHDAPTPTAEEVDAALAELDSIPDGVCEAGDVEEEEEDEEEWSYFRMEPQTQPQGEDVLVPGGPTAPVAPPSEAPQSVDTVIDGEGIVAAAPKSPSHEDLLTSPMEAAPQDQVIGEVYSEKIPSPHEADQPPVMENPPDILQAGVDEGTFGFESSARTLDLMQTSMDKVPDLMEGNFEQPSSPHGSVSPRVPGSPRSVEGFVTSVELNTPEENFGTNFAINQNQDSLTSAMEQPSGPFSVYVSSSPEPSSLEPSLQAPVDLVNFSGVANGQVEEESSQVALDSPVEIVHAQSTVEVVAPPSPVDIAGPETQFIIPEHETGQANTDVQQPSDITFVPEKAVEPVAEVPVSVFVDESTPVSEPDTADLLGQEVVSPAVESPLTPVETSPAPVEELISPVEYTPAQEEPIPSPVEPTPAPVEPTPAPVEPTSAPVEPTPAPVEPTPAPVEPTPAPVEPTPAPVEPTPAPIEPTPAPVEPTPAPVEPTPAPVEPTPAPVEPTPAPVEPTPAPVESTPTPVEATLPSEPTSEKVETPAPAAAVPAKAAAKTVKEGAPTPKVRTPAKTTKAPVTKATPDKKPTPGRATPARPTPGKATPTRTPISKTPTPKATEKTASPKPLSRVAPTKPAADKPTAAKPGTARPASAKPTATRPATGTAGATRPTATRPLARKPAEKPAATTSTTTKAPATRPTTGAPRPGSARPIPAARTTTTSTVKKTAPTKTADKPDAGKLVNGSATRTTTARKPLTQTATKTSTTRPAAEKETKNTTNRILSTTRPASKPGTTATTRPTVSRTAAAARSSTTESKTTSRVDATTKARTSTTTKSAATRTAGVAVKKTLVTKTKTAGTKTAATKAEKSEATVLETSEPVVNGENKIADEETSVEVIEKCAVEDIMKASSEKVITESSQTMTTSEQVVVTTETTEVIVNGDH